MISKSRRFKISKKVEVLEMAPGYRTIVVQHYSRQSYFLWFPYVVHILRKHGNLRKNKNSIKRSIHIGLRTTPLNEQNIKDEILLYPPLGNIYCKWLMACSEPSIEGFWSSSFNFGWPCYKLMNDVGIMSHENWAKMKPAELLDIFNNWPGIMDFAYNSKDGLWGMNDVAKMPTKMKLSECLSEIYPDSLNHVNELP